MIQMTRTNTANIGYMLDRLSLHGYIAIIPDLCIFGEAKLPVSSAKPG
jgi:hypothetical protein